MRRIRAHRALVSLEADAPALLYVSYPQESTAADTAGRRVICPDHRVILYVRTDVLSHELLTRVFQELEDIDLNLPYKP